MKTRTFLTSLVVIAGLACVTAFQADAQGGGGGGGGGGRGGRGGRGGGLTPEQTTKMTDAMAGSQADVQKLNESLRAAQKEAVTAALASNPDQKTVEAKIDAVLKIQGDIAKLRYSKAVKAVAADITPEQKATLDTAPAGLYNALFGGGGFGGGGRGGRGGAGGGRRGGGGGGGGI